ncbi:STAS domain-containing protein [Maridesulfovibrio hydrothermalis]|uniref:Stage II sporulation protein n=1 Tax=Maridesulfovibrio hydrothermalis AM13 = DSM 14728 TaxID=1121451 RepID=L0R767_9BACT|nr:STAS domain-containing protein [Maridesulfovibrio hydrothermalis]CCO22057.1 Stage II sporulation protein [Maridesulfovibrio hydrothermalis AM13 = DSM 14728]
MKKIDEIPDTDPDNLSIADSLSFDFTEEEIEGYKVLCPRGSVNNATVKFMKNRLYDLSCENGCKLIMSMKEVDSIDSVGLGTLISAHKKCNDCGGKIVFSDLNPMILRNMKMLCMDRYLNMTQDIQSAQELFD